MSKEQMKKAFESAEQELENKEIERLKGIVKNLLERKRAKEVEKEKLEEDIKLIKQDIEDFKAGRLDKAKERHEKNPRADEASPIQITIINDNSRVIAPFRPWNWSYQVQWVSTPLYMTTTGHTGTSFVGLNATTSTINLCASATGANFGTFTSGTYELGNGSIVSL